MNCYLHCLDNHNFHFILFSWSGKSVSPVNFQQICKRPAIMHFNVKYHTPRKLHKASVVSGDSKLLREKLMTTLPLHLHVKEFKYSGTTGFQKKEFEFNVKLD